MSARRRKGSFGGWGVPPTSGEGGGADRKDGRHVRRRHAGPAAGAHSRRAASRDRTNPRDANPGSVRRRQAGSVRQATKAELVLGSDEPTLLDLVDNVLSKGVVLTGDVTLGLAQVDLVYARLSLLLCAADRVMPGEDRDPIARHSARHVMRDRVKHARRRG